MSDGPDGAEPTPSEPAGSVSRSGLRSKAVGAIIAVLVIAVIALVIALVQSDNNSPTAKKGARAVGSTTSVTASGAASGSSGAGGVVEVNGGGKNVGAKPPPPTDTGTTAASTDTTSTSPGDTTTTATGTTGGGIHHFPIGPLPSLVIKQPPQERLDYQASAQFGEANLSAGFSPDPYSVGVTTSGPVDVSYLGSACRGFASSAPTLRVNYGGGGGSLLRLYFVGSNGDPSFVVNDPYGNYYCVDDSFGTVNPTIDFNNPAGGTYDIWVAADASNTSISGTLYITENSGNHP